MTSPVHGVVREWWPEEGWGVIDSDATPGGCWVHYSALRIPSPAGYKELTPGEAVEMVVERFPQDGYDYRSDALWLAGTDPVDDAIRIEDASAFMSGVMISFDDSPVAVELGAGVDLDAAVDVWRRAREAAGEPPVEARVARVREKVRDSEALVLVARVDGAVVGMAVLEPFRGDPSTAHVSMVFVDPAHQGQGAGSALLHTAHALGGARGWTSSSVWTRESNAAAQALYASTGYRATDDLGETPSGEVTRRWVR